MSHFWSIRRGAGWYRVAQKAVGGAAACLLSTGVVVGAVGVVAPAAPASASTSMSLGVLEADYRYLAGDQAAGISNASINLSWSNWETTPGVFSSTYIQSIQAAVQRYRAAGWSVTVDVGLQQGPSWLLQGAGSELVDQRGGLSGTADFEFSTAVRAAASGYIASVVTSLPGVSGYRIGLSENGETLYPDTSSNQWWAFAPQAQSSGADLPATVGANPMPGWVPGATTWNGAAVTSTQAQTWYSWYSGALVDAHAWEMSTFRQAGFAGSLHLVMPGMGALPGPMNQRLAADLAPGPYDSFYTLNTGAVWWKVLDSLPSLANTVIDVSSVYDGSGSPRGNSCQAGDSAVAYTDPQVYSWSDTRWLTSLAVRHGLGVIGENPGGTPVADLAPLMTLAKSCGLRTLQWAWDYSLQGSGPVSAVQVGMAAGTAQSPAALTPAFTISLNVSNSSAHLKLGVAGASLTPGAAITDWWNDGSSNQSWRFVSLGGTTYNLVNAHSSQCLTTDGKLGDGLTQSPCAGTAGQVWSTVLQPGDPAAETIENPASQLYVDVAGNSINPGATMLGWTSSGHVNQVFGASSAAVQPAFTTPLDVSNSRAHLKVAVSGASLAPGAAVTDWWNDGSSTESWRFVSLGGTSYNLVNAKSGQCLTTDGKLGDGLTQAPCTATFGQAWSTTLRPGGVPAAIENPASQLYIDVAANSLNPAATIHAWSYNGHPNQLFGAY